MKKIILNIILIPVSFFFTGICFAQNEPLKDIFKLLSEKKQDSAITILNTIDTKSLSSFQAGNYYKATAILKLQEDLHPEAFEAFKKAKKNTK